MDLTTILGLPLHPLVVHAVVVLLPLAALGAVCIAVRPAWRRRYGTLVLLLTVAAVASVPVALVTGDQLRTALNLANPLVDAHADLGATLLPVAVPFLVLVIGFLVAGRKADHEREAGADAAATWRRVALVAAVLVALAGVASTVQVVRIGHSGATAVWNGVGGS
ncbi:putative membrane protein [Crossiella equi]|uniref:Membrane protein n=1 Tax=Crossiella equi TaxID=130796 RepID=A0ABS5AJK0_9PSEU|nr:DUF2231 domain-containing protein [Crossiella equi]MBP2476746.1 putative membrane protein [Crossiella equi]